MICVIADDLSGAAELAGVGLNYGLSAKVHLGLQPDSDADPSRGADLICIDTDSRACAAEEAAWRVSQVATYCRHAGIDLVFKKVDSVLRGQVVAELEALMKGLGRKRSILVPANPGMGRVIRRGVYMIDGVPLHQTGFAQDPEHPAYSSSVLDLLAPSLDVAVQLLPSDGQPGEGIQVGEAVSPADVSSWAKKLDEQTVPAGAAEFFGAFLEKMDLQPVQSVGNYEICGIQDHSLFVCGSVSEYSRALCRGWEARGWPLLRMPAGLFDGDSQENPLIERWADGAVAAFRQCHRVMVAIDRPLCYAPGVQERLHRHLGAVVHRILERVPISCLFAEGGATAAALVRRLGWQRLRVEQELAPGIVCMRSLDRAGPWLTIKPGSYPWPEWVVSL